MENWDIRPYDIKMKNSIGLDATIMLMWVLI